MPGMRVKPCATVVGCAIALGLATVLWIAPAGAFEGDTVVLQGLDKVTARVKTFEAPIDRPVRFGTLYIVIRTCERTPPEEPPESAAYLDIYEVRAGQQPIDLFHGWMFASSPALNALEHPVYDVWVLECKRTKPMEPGSPKPQAK